jgi:hypothetical protein
MKKKLLFAKAPIFVCTTMIERLPNQAMVRVTNRGNTTPQQVFENIKTTTPNVNASKAPENFNGIVKVAIGIPRAAMPSGFQVSYDNTAGAGNVNVMIGDPTGVIAAANGGTYVTPTSGTLDPATIFKTFGATPFTSKLFKYQVYGINPGTGADLVDASLQFDANFYPMTGDINGNRGAVNGDTSISLSGLNNQYRPNIITVDTSESPLEFTNFNALVVQTLRYYGWNLTFMTGIAMGRVGN